MGISGFALEFRQLVVLQYSMNYLDIKLPPSGECLYLFAADDCITNQLAEHVVK